MANLSESLITLEKLYDEKIEAIVVGQHDNVPWGSPKLTDEDIVLDRDAGLAKLDRDYDNGYGGADCFPFFAWTKSRVFFVAEYDGATGIAWVPRFPMAIAPEFSGNSCTREAQIASGTNP